MEKSKFSREEKLIILREALERGYPTGQPHIVGAKLR